MDKEYVLTAREGRVGVITLNRPDSLNALDVPMLLGMERALSDLEGDPEIGAIVVTGAGDRAFMAGGDIADLNRRRALEHYEQFTLHVVRVFRRFEECSKPTLAAVNGWALGGGLEFLLTLDLRLMAQDAQLGLPEVRLGLFPGGGGSQRLMRQIPLCQAKMLMFTGDSISADEAVGFGIVNRAVPREQLMAQTMALAQRIGSYSSWALRLLKSSMLHGASMPLNAALMHEAAAISLVFGTDDAHEGLSAFLEKRKPVFKGC